MLIWQVPAREQERRRIVQPLPVVARSYGGKRALVERERAIRSPIWRSGGDLCGNSAGSQPESEPQDVPLSDAVDLVGAGAQSVSWWSRT